MSRHQELETLYVPPLDKERAVAEDPAVFAHWVDLFLRAKTENEVEIPDIYNMDEKGFLQGVIAKLRVMISKHEMKPHMTQCENREWVSLIECVSMDGRLLKPWIIFKGKQQQKAWWQNDHGDNFDGHIALSEKGRTDNEIGLAWLQDAFQPETSRVQKGEFRILLVDGHASHITTKAIQYCVEHKIILLCLPAHTTHILQPLDIGVFAPLAAAYKNHVHRTTCFGANYNIDKVDFIELYQKARTGAVTPENITKAWAKSGLQPYKPEIVLDRFLPLQQTCIINGDASRPKTPTDITFLGPHGSFRVDVTPTNALQVQQLFNKVSKNELVNPELIQAFKKVSKAAKRLMADSTLHSSTNRDLLELNRQQEKKRRRAKGNYGVAKVMNQDVVNERRDDLKEKLWHKEATNWMKGLRQHIFTSPLPKTPKKPPATPRRASTPSPSLVSRPSQAPPKQKKVVRKVRKVVKLPIRVTIREFDQGLQAAQILQKRSTEGHVPDEINQMGRGRRIKKASKACT